MQNAHMQFVWQDWRLEKLPGYERIRGAGGLFYSLPGIKIHDGLHCCQFVALATIVCFTSPPPHNHTHIYTHMPAGPKAFGILCEMFSQRKNRRDSAL